MPVGRQTAGTGLESSKKGKSVFGDQLFTRRLCLRRIRQEDLRLILAWSNSESAYGAYLTPDRLNAAALEDQFTKGGLWTAHDKTFLIETREPIVPLGTIHYWLRQDQGDSAIVSVKIAEAAERGRGYGTEAQKFLIIHLFDHVGVKTVQMYTDINNRPQQRCLEKLGFSIECSLTYDDRQVVRTGYLYELAERDFRQKPIYRFHYE
jgi:RimJ/RimL family protein N-acetyltransferase